MLVQAHGFKNKSSWCKRSISKPLAGARLILMHGQPAPAKGLLMERLHHESKHPAGDQPLDLQGYRAGPVTVHIRCRHRVQDQARRQGQMHWCGRAAIGPGCRGAVCKPAWQPRRAAHLPCPAGPSAMPSVLCAAQPIQGIKLVGGALSGLLEVKVKGEWGSVCNVGEPLPAFLPVCLPACLKSAYSHACWPVCLRIPFPCPFCLLDERGISAAA